jgi:membrane protease YdiL (CAAX protease family)
VTAIGSSPARPATASDLRFLAFAGAVIVVNNLINVWRGHGNEHPVLSGIAIALMWAAIFWWTFRLERLTARDLGFCRDNLGASAAWGLAAGIAMALLPMVFFLVPIIMPRSVQFVAFPIPATEMLPLAILSITLRNTTAIFEEFLFRGLIQARGSRWLGMTRGIALSVGLFVVWHTVITFQGIQETNLTDAVVPWPLLYVASAIPLAVAGVVFSLLRSRTDNLAGPTVAHWAVNTLMQSLLVILSAA